MGHEEAFILKPEHNTRSDSLNGDWGRQYDDKYCVTIEIRFCHTVDTEVPVYLIFLDVLGRMSVLNLYIIFASV